jgi:hypothetical protein
VAEVLQLLTQLDIVVDLTIEDDPRTAILVVNGLLTALEVDNGESAHGQTDRAVDVETILIGSAMTDCFIHPPQQLLVNWFSVISNEPYDSTHKLAILANLPEAVQNGPVRQDLQDLAGLHFHPE